MVRRAPSGHRLGESHHRAKHSDATVERARVLREAGCSLGTIARALDVSLWTVRDWVEYRTR
jgi:hypothetical protein